MSARKNLHRRCALFVSALNLDNVGAALTSGADIICVDLEDAVPPDQKTDARDAFITSLRNLSIPDAVQLIARVNNLRSRVGMSDMIALLAEPGRLGGILLPKVESGEEIIWAAELLAEAAANIDLYAIIETPAAVERCQSIALSHPRLRALFFGGFDLSTALGCDMAWEPLLYARSRVVQAAAMAGLDVLDSPFQSVDDAKGLRAAVERAKAIGMTGKTTKYVTQVDTIRDVFTPTSSEIRRAEQILRLFDLAPGKPLIFDGKLIELPTIKRIRRTASFAGHTPLLTE